MDGERKSIEDLHEATGVKVRTLRLWTQEGLLERPGMGRYASYPAGTVEAVLRIKEMKLDGAPLSEIRQALASDGRPASAQSYLDGLRVSGAFKGADDSGRVEPGSDAALRTRARGQGSRQLLPPVATLVRVEVAPNVHLVAEGPLSPGETETLRLAALAALSVLNARKSEGTS